MVESLAVRYRPRRFADVAGQEHAVAVLRSAVMRPEPPQQILLAGPSGLGKTTTARIFAAALLCPHRTPEGDACGLCDSCLEITGPSGSHPDVLELDAASNGGKDEIRDLAQRAVLAPLRGRWKVYIVDEAHGLTSPGGQAFLRLLEEPPGHCIFILATTDPGKLPVALQGRCLYLEVTPPSPEQLLANLHRIATGEDWALPGWAANAVLDAADPALGVRGTVTTLDKLAGVLTDGAVTEADVQRLLGVADHRQLSDLTAAILAGDRAAALALTDALERGQGRSFLRRWLTSWARDELIDAAARGDCVEAAFFRFATLAEAPTYDGALLIAVARATRPDLAQTTEAVSALLEQARAAASACAHSFAERRPAEPATPDPPPSTLPTDEPAALAVAPPSNPAATAKGGPVLSLSDPAMLSLLNAVSAVSGPAAFLLRRCQVRLDGISFVVHVPQDLRPRAVAYDLAGVVTRASAGLGAPIVIDDPAITL